MPTSHRSLEIVRILSSRSTMRIARELGLVRPTEPTAEGARCLRELLERLGTTFIKLGQLLASRPDLIGELYAHELSALTDDTMPLPAATVRATIEQSLGRPLDELFTSFDDEPLASASIAQAHTAQLRADGALVVVKVRRPDIAGEIIRDLKILERLARRVESHVNAARLLQLRGVADELSWSLRRELDMRSDAANGRIVAEAMEDFDLVRVPYIYEELTTDAVMVMERIDGERADSPLVATLPAERRTELARQLLRAYVRQILVVGVYHADPHPGNVLVRIGDGSLVILDYGLLGRLDDNTRQELTFALLAMAENRAGDMATMLLRMSTLDHGSDGQRFENELRRLLPRYHRVGIAGIEVGTALLDVQKLALQCGIALPIPFALIGKTLSQIDSIARALDPDIDPLETIRAATMPLMGEQLEALLTPSSLFAIAAPRATALLDLPDRTARLLDGLERGSASIHITPQLDAAVGELHTITNRLAAAIVLGCAIIASALLMRMSGDEAGTIAGYPALGFLGFTSAFLVSLLLIVRMLRSEGGL